MKSLCKCHISWLSLSALQVDLGTVLRRLSSEFTLLEAMGLCSNVTCVHAMYDDDKVVYVVLDFAGGGDLQEYFEVSLFDTSDYSIVVWMCFYRRSSLYPPVGVMVYCCCSAAKNGAFSVDVSIGVLCIGNG